MEYLALMKVEITHFQENKWWMDLERIILIEAIQSQEENKVHVLFPIQILPVTYMQKWTSGYSITYRNKNKKV